jgi:hypothetical protein
MSEKVTMVLFKDRNMVHTDIFRPELLIKAWASLLTVPPTEWVWFGCYARMIFMGSRKRSSE